MSGAVWERIEKSRASHNVLEHPFYVRWSAGELSREELARYAGQYRHATEALARLCRQTAERAPDARRDEIAGHAGEEEAHVGLWDDFVEAAGGEIGAEPTPETAECVRAWTAPDGYLAAARAHLRDRERPARDLARSSGRAWRASTASTAVPAASTSGSTRSRPRPRRGVPPADRRGDDAGGRGRPRRGGRGRLQSPTGASSTGSAEREPANSPALLAAGRPLHRHRARGRPRDRGHHPVPVPELSQHDR